MTSNSGSRTTATSDGFRCRKKPTLAGLLTCLLLTAAAPLSIAQSGSPEVGFVRIIHAVAAGSGKARFSVDGDDLFPKGYDLGQATGGIGLAAGSHEITISRSGAKPGTSRIQLQSGETITLIGFSEPIPKSTPTAQQTWKIRLLRLRQSSPESGYQLSLVSVCPEPETVVQTEIAGKSSRRQARVEPFHITTQPLGRSRAEVFVRSGPELLTTVSPDSPGNYVVVLYRDAGGQLRALSFFDPKFVVAG